MLTPQPILQTSEARTDQQVKRSDRIALAFLSLAMFYLVLGLLFGSTGSMQYLLPSFLRDQLAFQKTRPLHVFLATSWIFTAAQGGLYYYLPRIKNTGLFWLKGAQLHLALQVLTSFGIVVAFLFGKFGGREYLEFPPLLGLCIAVSWIPFVINFFGTLRPDFRNAPVYYFSWTVGVLFFLITLSESYLWTFDFFNHNQVRDTTVQWKALGSMVGSWNMLIYGTSIYLMEQIKGDRRISRSPLTFFFFFLGFTNLLFNWGHHTYVVPAAPWIKTVSYVISMTELLIFGQILYKFRKTLGTMQREYHSLTMRLFGFADLWVLLNLGAAIAISVPALNAYTHGTHITVAHAMGTTIGINTMLLFASLFYILQKQFPAAVDRYRSWIAKGISITNIALVFFWASLIGSGLVKISGQVSNKAFAEIMEASRPLFKLFAASGLFIVLGITLMIVAAYRVIMKRKTQLSDVALVADQRA
jgi:nitric oxide reductase subunit B